MKKALLLLCISFLGHTEVNAQRAVYELMKRRDITLKRNKELADEYFRKVGIQQGSGYKQYQRWYYEQSFHLDREGFILKPVQEFQHPFTYSFFNPPSEQTSCNPTTGYWKELGPSAKNPIGGWNPGTGCLTSLAIHPGNPNILYVGSPGGGIWKSTDGGTTWSSKMNCPAQWMYIASLAINPQHPDIIYAGTLNHANQIIRSTDAGLTWKAIGAGPTGKISKILIHPLQTDTLFACAENGIFRSADSGNHWIKVHDSCAEDIEFKPGDPQKLYAAGPDWVWKSTDGGYNWTTLGVAQNITGTGRTLLAVTPANPNVVYVVRSNGDVFGSLFKSVDNGLNFTLQVTDIPHATHNHNYMGYSPDGTDESGQAFHDLALCVSPVNEQLLYLGGILTWVSVDSGKSFQALTKWNWKDTSTAYGYNHADIQDLQIQGNTLFAVTDGGLFKRVGNDTTWIDLSAGLGIRQFYRMASSATHDSVLAGGCQDNGSSLRQTNGSWAEWLGGDGMESHISAINPQHIWGSAQEGWLYKTTNGGVTYTPLGIIPGNQWVTPYVVHPQLGNILYGGGDQIVRSTDSGATWMPYMNGPLHIEPIRDIAISSTNPNVLYASGDTHFYYTQDGGATWDDYLVSNYGEITDIVISPLNPNKVWITTKNNPNGRVYVSQDHGQSFENISMGLPAISARTIVLDNTPQETLFVGLNVGVFTYSSTNPQWISITDNLPHVPINELDLQHDLGKLRIATYGRGVWETSIPRISIALSGGNSNGCGNQNFIFTASTQFAGANPVFDWYINDSLVPGVHAAVFSTTNLQYADRIQCKLITNGQFVIGIPVYSNIIHLQTMNPPSLQPFANPYIICEGNTTQLMANATSTQKRKLSTPLFIADTSQGAVFNIISNQAIQLTGLKMHLGANVSMYEVWYKSGGYGNTNVNSSAGWNHLVTYPVNSNGYGTFTPIPIPVLSLGAGQTTALLFVCNGDVYAGQGTLPGTVFANTTELSITEGHGGNGLFGNFNFTRSPLKVHCVLEYEFDATIMSFNWMPAPGLNDSTLENPISSPLMSTTYTLQVTDAYGCTASNSVSIIVNPLPSILAIGAAPTASPSSLCLGDSITLQKPMPSPACAMQQGFANAYSPQSSLYGNYVYYLGYYVLPEGNYDISKAPDSISLSTYGQSNQFGGKYALPINCDGYVSLQWTYAPDWNSPYTPVWATITSHHPYLGLIDSFGALVWIPLPGYDSNLTTSQSGFLTLPVSAGKPVVFALFEGSAGVPFVQSTFTLKNLLAHYADYYSMAWYDDSVGGNQLGYADNNPFVYSMTDSVRIKSFSTGRKKYYVELINPYTGCVSRRQASGDVNITSPPQVSTLAIPSSFCAGDTTQLLAYATSATTYHLTTPLTGNQQQAGYVFDMTASQPLILKSLKAFLGPGTTQAEVWYKLGGYGNVNFASSAGWVKLGNTLTISSLGPNQLTTLALTSSLPMASGQTYGIALVTNGTVYGDSFGVPGSVWAMNPEITLSSGHAGSGLGGNFTFNLASMAWKGEVVYEVNSSISNYAWSPVNNLSNPFVSNPKASPLTSSVYYITATDAYGCSRSAVQTVFVKPPPVMGNAVVSPAVVCQHDQLNLQYTAPPGPTCNGDRVSGFTGVYAPAQWSFVDSNVSGSVFVGYAPNEINLYSTGTYGYPTANPGYVNYSVTAVCDGIVSFNWSIVHPMIPGNKYWCLPRYSVNGGGYSVFPFFDPQGSSYQQGVLHVYVPAGQTLALQLYSPDSIKESCQLQLSNWIAPVSSMAIQNVNWYNSSVGGNWIGNQNPQIYTDTVAGVHHFFAYVSNSPLGCISTLPVASNAIQVNPKPPAVVSALKDTLCSGDSMQLTADTGSSYHWLHNGDTSQSISVSPVSTTTYTVIVTSSQGCTSMATRTVFVLPKPSVNATASANSICLGISVQLQASGAQTYQWLPGPLPGSVINVQPSVTTNYMVIGTNAAGCSQTASITIHVITCGALSVLNLKLFIEGYYDGGGLMKPVMLHQGIAGALPNQTDTITVELRHPVAPYAVVASQQVILHTDGTAVCNFPISGSYYLAIHHRNALQTWSADPVLLGATPVLYDFTTGFDKAYGDNLSGLTFGVYALYSGDLNRDENFDLSDFSLQESSILQFAAGYEVADLNGDGNVDILDAPLLEYNVQSFIFSTHP